MKTARTTLRLPATRLGSVVKPQRVGEVDPTVKAVLGDAVILPTKRGRVVPIHSAEQSAVEYGDPALVMEYHQFIEFGCGACQHHQRKPDRSEFHCDLGVRLWPEGTNKTCRGFIRRRKPRPEQKTIQNR